MSQSADYIDAPHNIFTQPNGTVIIEKIDSPAIRRERFLRRKAERQRYMETSLGAQENIIESQTDSSKTLINLMEKVEGPKKAQTLDGFEDESELSELSEDESESNSTQKEEMKAKPSLPKEKFKKQQKPPKKQSLKIEQFEDSTIGELVISANR